MVPHRSHISTASGRAWKEGRLDVTGAMMVLTLKIISAAACYQDGGKPDAVCMRCPNGSSLHYDAVQIRNACL